MNFSVDDFSWDGVVYIVYTKELNLSQKSQISMCYQSRATENGDLYLVPKPERNDMPISVYVYTQIQNGTAIKIPFQWLYSDSCITTLPDCNVNNGTYDDCKSIGGLKKCCITHVKKELKQNIQSIIVPEFAGIDDVVID